MTKFIMMVGFPGSGKSTYASKLAEQENAIICSSDAIREELFGSEDDQAHNDEVFKVLHERIISGLKAGNNMIYDATNISSKTRRGFLQQISKISCEKIACLVATPYEMCIERNASRDRVVPEYVIKHMYMNFTVPCTQEGFDVVNVVYPEGHQEVAYVDILEKAKSILHDNPHHSASIGEHMYNAHEYLIKNTNMIEILKDDTLTLKFATLLHDIGKPFTKVFTNSNGEPTEIAHYYNHNNVGAYEILFTTIPNEIKIDVALLIQYHMQYYISWKQSAKSEAKDREFLGERLSKMLDILHECDLNAH